MRWRIRSAYDVLAHAGLADIDAEFEKLAMDAGCTPKWILAAHLPNHWRISFDTGGRPGWPCPNFPGPVQPEVFTVPANDGFRLDDDQGRSPIAPNFAQPRPSEPIGKSQLWPLHRATQDAELVPECEVFELKGIEI